MIQPQSYLTIADNKKAPEAFATSAFLTDKWLLNLGSNQGPTD